MQQQAEEEELGLSPLALAALTEFALENNLLGPEVEDADDVRLQVQERMDVTQKTHEFKFTFGDNDDGDGGGGGGGGGDDDDDAHQFCVALTGVNPELGQTLASTGLTVWRASQEMARFMWEHRRWFVGKRVVELGAGLGLCGILASHLCVGGKVVVTDGGDEFTDSAMEALRKNLEKNSCSMVESSRVVDEGRRTAAPLAENGGWENGRGGGGRGTGEGGAEVCLERLTWGEHDAFLGRYGGVDGGIGGGFDFIVAADVIYEEEAVTPLLHTVVDILKLRQNAGDNPRRGHLPVAQQATGEAGVNRNARREDTGPVDGAGGLPSVPPTPRCCSPAPPAESTFLLAFARRNVSIDRVLREAEGLGLRWRVPENFEPTSSSENIYLMCFDQ